MIDIKLFQQLDWREHLAIPVRVFNNCWEELDHNIGTWQENTIGTVELVRVGTSNIRATFYWGGEPNEIQITEYPVVLTNTSDFRFLIINSNEYKIRLFLRNYLLFNPSIGIEPIIMSNDEFLSLLEQFNKVTGQDLLFLASSNSYARTGKNRNMLMKGI